MLRRCWVCAGMLGERGLGWVAHFPLWYVAKINSQWPWPWPWRLMHENKHWKVPECIRRGASCMHACECWDVLLQCMQAKWRDKMYLPTKASGAECIRRWVSRPAAGPAHLHPYEKKKTSWAPHDMNQTKSFCRWVCCHVYVNQVDANSVSGTSGPVVQCSRPSLMYCISDTNLSIS